MGLPQSFASVVPYLVVEEGHRYCAFLVNGLEGTLLGQHLDERGRIKHAQVQLGNTLVMVSDSSDAYPVTTGQYVVYVDDAHRVTALALAAGAQSVMDVTDQPYGDRQSGVKDCANNVWWITQRLTTTPYFDEAVAT